MNKTKTLTGLFSFGQAVYWMGFCAAVTFAAVHLHALGYSNTQLGIVMAIGNVLGAVIGPVLAAVSEKHPGVGTDRFNLPLFAVRVLALAVLAVHAKNHVLCSAAYVFYIGSAVAVNSVNLKFCVDAEARGIPLNYGVGRGAGSLAFVALSFVLGIPVEQFGVQVLVYVGFAILALQIAANLLIGRRLHNTPLQQVREAEKQKTSSLPRFLAEEPRFSVFLLGAVLIFFAHNSSCNFMINITENVGGDTASMGYLNAWMAAMEIPVMLLFSLFLRGKRVSTLLRLSLLAFVLKTAAIAMAPNLPLLFAAHTLQAFSFALFSCAIVPYVSRVIPMRNAAKAQSLAFSVTNVGAVLASLVAGRLYDVCTVQQTMLIATAVCAVGTAVAILGTKRTQPEAQKEQKELV